MRTIETEYRLLKENVERFADRFMAKHYRR